MQQKQQQHHHHHQQQQQSSTATSSSSSTSTSSSSNNNNGTSDALPNKCYILGASGIVRIQSNKYHALSDILKKEPFLSPIPSDRLFGSPSVPYQLKDPARRLLLSGSMTAFMANKIGVPIENPFTKDNVGVHSDICLMLFRKLTEVEGAKEAPSLYHHLADFIEEIILDGSSTMSLTQCPADLLTFLADLRDPLVDEEAIIAHPTVMPDDVYSALCVDVYRFLLQEARALGTKTAKDLDLILANIGSCNRSAVKVCLNHGLLPQFMPKHLHHNCHPTSCPRTHIPFSPMQDTEIGDFIVRLHRHTLVHLVEPQVVSLVKHNFLTFDAMKMTRADIVQNLRAFYPDFLISSFHAMVQGQVYDYLNVPSKFPIPDIYLACPSNDVSKAEVQEWIQAGVLLLMQAAAGEANWYREGVQGLISSQDEA